MIIDTTKLEERIQSLGFEIFHEVQNSSPGVFDPQFYTAKLLDWSMGDDEFKVSLFRFVDVFPVLQDGAAVVRHAQEYFEPVSEKVPGLLKWGLKVDPKSLSAKMAAPVIAKQIRSMAEKFIVGETAEGALKGLRAIRKAGFAFTVDLLGEATLSEAESRQYLEKYLSLVDTLSKEVPSWRESAPIVSDHQGERTPVQISVKLSSLYSQTRVVATDESVAVLAERLRQIFLRAKEKKAAVCVDMEDTALVSITLASFRRALETDELRDWDGAGIVLQAYLRRTTKDLEALLDWVRDRKTPISVRLVKGAYWDSESVSAIQHVWPLPVWGKKESTDANYEQLALKLLDNHQIVYPALGSHNLRSLCAAIAAAEMLGVPPTHFELQALYGMAEPIKAAFAKRGFLVREYAPIGDLIPGMSYLVRRLLENTSNEGFLRQSFREHEKPEVLLARPERDPADTGEGHLPTSHETFTNCPFFDFSEDDVRTAFGRAVASTKNRLRATRQIVKPVVQGEYVETGNLIHSRCPEEPSVVLAEAHAADVALCERALKGLHEYFPKWRATPVEERAQILMRAADLMVERRTDLASLIVLEVGKPWTDADGDVCEAVDFCHYYALEMLRLAKPRFMGNLPGERNTYFYEPRGVAVVISPWNFPLAIPCGMFAAALVTGNCAILKPAEQSPLIAAQLFDIFLAAGLPDEAAAFLPGFGEEIGPFLVEHRAVSTIAFTGSKAVGLSIIESAARTSNSAEHVKRVVAEMGGKNAIVIDDDADLDEAIRGVVHSAFNFQGQKCSACARAIVVSKVYDRFVSRLSEVVRSLKVAPATDATSVIGPVIDDDAHRRILSLIDDARRSCRVLAEGPEPGAECADGYFVRPICFGDVPSGHPLTKLEIFGPVLTVERAPDFETAIEMALDSEYALTGAVFSRSPKHIDYALREFRVGNLYINRGSTGALVMRQPFGGAKMSGVGSKAGGPDYLLQFLYPRSVSENTMRRGFTPQAEVSGEGI